MRSTPRGSAYGGLELNPVSSLSAVVLTRNEERHIAPCLKTLSWADELLVVDSHSTDATCAIAKGLGARVVPHDFTDFARARNSAISLCHNDWVLMVDADERVSLEL